MINKKITFLNFSLIVFLFCFFSVSNASASEVVDISVTGWSDSAGVELAERWQSFKPTKENLSSIDLLLYKTIATPSLFLRIYDTVDLENVVEIQFLNIIASGTVAGFYEWYNLNFTDTEVVTGRSYKIYLSTDSLDGEFSFLINTSGSYTDGAYSQNGAWDMAFKTYYETTFDPYKDIDVSYSNYDYELDINYPDYNTILSKTCIIGNECAIWFSFNELAIGYPMYLTYYDATTTPDYAISSTTITESIFWQNKIIVPDIIEESTIQYNTLLDADSFGWIVKTGIAVKWVSSTTWENFILDQVGTSGLEDYCAVEEICADVATSSDFLFGFQCGARQSICWIFAPTEKSKEYIFKSIESFENSFPFNLYFSFINRLEDEIQENEENTNSISIPFIDDQGKYFMLPVITTSSVPDALGTSYDTVYNGLVYMIWIIMALLIVLIVYIVIW